MCSCCGSKKKETEKKQTCDTEKKQTCGSEKRQTKKCCG
jgi:hypothetical protein